jgi:hypothetical protein
MRTIGSSADAFIFGLHGFGSRGGKRRLRGGRGHVGDIPFHPPLEGALRSMVKSGLRTATAPSRPKFVSDRIEPSVFAGRPDSTTR